jgi:hypothetical protein
MDDCPLRGELGRLLGAQEAVPVENSRLEEAPMLARHEVDGRPESRWVRRLLVEWSLVAGPPGRRQVGARSLDSSRLCVGAVGWSDGCPAKPVQAGSDLAPNICPGLLARATRDLGP